MSSPVVSVLNAFVASSRSAAAASEGRGGLVGVLGNEGGDMDSVVGSICLAFALQNGAITLARQHPTVHAVQYVPLLNFPKDDLPLRGDVTSELSAAGIDASNLVSVADGEEGGSRLDAFESLVLFDHNRLKPSQRGPDGAHEKRVIAIVDHHADEGQSLDAALRVLRQCGSACSLLVDLLGASAVASFPPEARRLLLAPIILDTMNFDPAVKKTTPVDVSAASILLGTAAARSDSAEVSASDVAALCGEAFKRLMDEKGNVSGLTVAQNLRRDFKAFAMPNEELGKPLYIGVATWVESVKTVVARHGPDAFLSECATWTTNNKHGDHGLDALVIMFCYSGKDAGEMRRQALWLLPSEPTPSAAIAAASLRAFFAAEDFTAAGPRFAVSSELDSLFDVGGDGSTQRLGGVFAQNAFAVSRKALVPLLVDHVKTSKL